MRESYFLRREGGRGVSQYEETGGVEEEGESSSDSGDISSIVNVLAGIQGESLKGIQFFF